MAAGRLCVRARKGLWLVGTKAVVPTAVHNATPYRPQEPKLPLSDVELAQLENERLRADLREAQEQRDQLAAALNIKTRHYARTVISLEEAKALLAAQCTVVDGYATRLSSAEEMAVVAAAQILEADELRQALCLTRLQLAELKTIFASVHGVVTAVRTAKDLRAIAKWAGAGQPALDAARQVALGVPPAPLGEEAAHNMRLLNPSLPKVNYKEPLSPGGEAALRAMLEADGETGEDAYQRALRINMSADEDASDGGSSWPSSLSWLFEKPRSLYARVFGSDLPRHTVIMCGVVGEGGAGDGGAGGSGAGNGGAGGSGGAAAETPFGTARPAMPLKYSGGEDPHVEDWLSAMEIYLDLTNCPVDKWVVLASTYLEGAAAKAWNLEVMSRKAASLAPPDWEGFKGYLRERFMASGRGIKARHQLDRLRMRGGDLDAYLHAFEGLRAGRCSG
ncbi:hypothetical protein Rsub_11702 [Raphidocelis subcapitata]|uniref:Retrotransposon gag domain-containing protein n=1 Tax=Raphidocelis subcapitata TaxID=307507 RepID=A0A2V0PHJ8_9CHLO|nr:hypothetical protein Rsub_11702 [Raphidocelis subcapitata]|eukprot:GBF98492.1 hypothetical protein Rsub_11702 [Raphidocelis subcapitata]